MRAFDWSRSITGTFNYKAVRELIQTGFIFQWSCQQKPLATNKNGHLKESLKLMELSTRINNEKNTITP